MQLSGYLKSTLKFQFCLKNTSCSKMPNDCFQILLSRVTLKHPISTQTLGLCSHFQFLAPRAYLHLANDVGQPFAARIFAFNWFIGHSICDDEEDFRQIGVVWSKDNWIVAVKKTNSKVPNHSNAIGVDLSWILGVCQKTCELAQQLFRVYLSIRSHRKSNVWTASSLSSLSGNQLSQWGRTRLRFTHSDWNLMTFPTAEMQFSVALTFSLERASAAWMTPTSKGIASGGETSIQTEE